MYESIAATALILTFGYWWWLKVTHPYFRDSQPIGGWVRYDRRKRATVIDPLMRAAWEAEHDTTKGA